MKSGIALLAIVAAACGRPAANAGDDRDPARCEAVARVASARPLLLDVELWCHGKPVTGFAIDEDARLAGAVTDAGGRALSRKGTHLFFPEPRREASIRYRIDLDATARANDSFDTALRRGGTLIAPVATWLAHPEPLHTDVPVTLRVETPRAVRFTTGLEHRDGAYRLNAHEIPVATYALFGSFESEITTLPGRARPARIEVAIADGELDVSRDVIRRWVLESARQVGKFWHGFPAPELLVTVIPVPERDRVVFGKVLPESSPGIVVLVGEHAGRERLYDDWILIHELFHLGVPSFSGEGKWFDEGLATYFEPLIRARAGWRSEHSVWEEFVRAMPQGLQALNARGLERADSFAGIYWGGAIVVMMADVEIRRATHGQRGLEDGLRGVLDAGGQSNEVWGLNETLALSDKSCGLSVLEPLARAHADHVSRVDLGAIWQELGLSQTAEGVALSSDVPSAKLRHSVVYGGP